MERSGGLSELFGDPVLRDYLTLNDRTIRLAVSRISAECDILKENAERNGGAVSRELEVIMAMCCRLMQISELYGILTRDLGGEHNGEAFELGAFLSRIVRGSSELLGGVCSFAADGTEKVYIETARDVLLYLFLSYIRKSVMNGASEMRFSYDVSGEKCRITVSASLTDKMRFERFEDFQYRHFDGVAADLCGRIGAEHEISDEKFSIVLSVVKDVDLSELRAPELDYEPVTFSYYNIMLRDLSEGFKE